MPLVTRKSKRLPDKCSDEGETDEHPSSPSQLVKSPSRTPSNKRKAVAKPVKKHNV